MGFLLGLLIGTVVTGVVFIVFGKNNKNKINKAREAIVGAYGKGESEVKQILEKIEGILKK